VTFIPKPGKVNNEAKAYRPVSLSSCLWKTTQKVIERSIRDCALSNHRNHHAYQRGKPTETAHHNVKTRTENATEHKDIALGAFLYVERTFDRTLTIKLAAERHGIEPTICRWI
jgi:hypothetical protein